MPDGPSHTEVRIDLVCTDSSADSSRFSIRQSGREIGTAALQSRVTSDFTKELAWYFDERDRVTAGTRARANWIDRELDATGIRLFQELFEHQDDPDLGRALLDPELRLTVTGPPSVQSIPWELLRNPALAVPYAVSGGLIRNATGEVISLDSNLAAPKILFVSGRPFEAKDSPYGAVLGSLLKACAEAGMPPAIELLSPATFPALIDALKRPGAFDMVHIDTHGRLLRQAEAAAFSRRLGGSADLPGFDGQAPFLFFNPVAGGPALVSAVDISSALAQAQVRCVVMNSCQSGAAGATSVDEATASLASAIQAAGVPLVIGMNRTVTVDAARELFGSFYAALFAGASAVEAVRRARTALQVTSRSPLTASAERLIRPNDWIIPCIYQSSPVHSPNDSNTAMAPGEREATRTVAEDLRSMVGPGQVIQRVFDGILQNRLVTVFGMRGVGKSSIAGTAARLTTISGRRLRVHRIDAAHRPLTVHLLEKQFPEWRGLSGLRGKLHLRAKPPDLSGSVVLLDNLEMAEAFYVGGDRRFSPLPELTRVLALLRQAGASVAMTVTGDPEGFGIDDSFHPVTVPPLSHFESRQLFLRTMAGAARELPPPEVERVKDAAVLARMCGGSALYCRELALWAIRHHSDVAERRTEILPGIQTLFTEMAIVRPNLGQYFAREDIWAALATLISISRGTYRLSEPDPNSAEELFDEADTIAAVILMILRNAGCVTSASPSKRVWRITPEVIPLTGFAPPRKRPIVEKVAAGFGPAYAQKAEALVRSSFDVRESARHRVGEQVDSELLNYVYAAISCIGHGNSEGAAWILRLLSTRCPSFLAENECRFVVDLISTFTRSALERQLASGSFEEAELELIEAIDGFRATVDTTANYHRESLTRAALGNVRDAAAKSTLEQALTHSDEMMKWRVDGIASKTSLAAQGGSVGVHAVDLLTSGMNAFENGRFEEAQRHFEQIRTRKDELANHYVWPVFLREEGALLSTLGRIEEAYDRVSEALSVFERSGDALQKAITLRVLSGIYRNAGKSDMAVVLLRESLKLFIEQEKPGAAAECIVNLGVIDLLAGRYQAAQTLFREALSLIHLTGLAKDSEYSAAFNLALTEIALGRVKAGLLKLVECAAVTRHRHSHVFVTCCWHIAQVGATVDRVWLDSRTAVIMAMSLGEIEQIADAHASELTGLPMMLDPS